MTPLPNPPPQGGREHTEREPIACLGAGRMGRGIAVVFAYAGHDVALVDFKPRDDAAFKKLANDALGEVRSTLGTLASFGLFDLAAVDKLMARVSVVPAALAACRTVVRQHHLRRRARGARSQARGACPRLEARRTGADHRINHVHHFGGRSFERRRTPWAFPQRALAQSGVPRAAGRNLARQAHRSGRHGRA